MKIKQLKKELEKFDEMKDVFIHHCSEIDDIISVSNNNGNAQLEGDSIINASTNKTEGDAMKITANLEVKPVVTELRKRNRFVLAEKVDTKKKLERDEIDLLKKFYGFKDSDFVVDQAAADQGMTSQSLAK